LIRSGAVLGLSVALLAAGQGGITIDYPEDGSLFPPEITPPMFLWRDSVSAAAVWRIDVAFADGSPGIRVTTPGPHLRIGPLDPQCVSRTNALPRLTPRQAVARTWTPTAKLWETIQRRSTAAPATVTLTGLHMQRAVSRGRVTLRTSPDPVGAPIFYRDVPLMPTETEKGQIKPLAPTALPLVKWRLRSVAEPASRVLLEDLPTCANCHSFSADGQTMGMDLDGLQNNRGLYLLAALRGEVAVRQDDVIQWSSPQGRLQGGIRVGFMSRVSPDGEYVATTVDPAALDPARPRHAPAPPSNYYVTNYPDYKFLQVFFPTRGFLCWYSRATGVLQPLAGADDPRFVHMGAVWSPDGKYLVFARAPAIEPNPEGAPAARFANDPNERQIRFDLYRIPFREGRGGVPEPVAGASRNGMSNTFPTVSPDGRWIVYVQCRNGMLMRPDSQLYIVPAAGGQARRMRANTSLMNSWHSFSPNGRWLVFSSKSRSPYTQMYLTHIDPDGHDSPAILIDNATAANRAVNLPEFVNVAPDGFRQVGGPAIDYYKLFNRALYLQKQGRLTESAAQWRKVLAIRENDAMAHDHLGMVLLLAGRRAEAAPHIRQAKELTLRATLEADASNAAAHHELGVLLFESGRAEEAVAQFRGALALDPRFAAAHASLGRALAAQGKTEEALAALRQALVADPRHAPAHFELGLLCEKRGRIEEAIHEWEEALKLDASHAAAHGRLGDALYRRGNTAAALAHWREAIRLQPNSLPVLLQAAMVLATSREAALRNGREAVSLGVRALQLSGGKDAAVLDALAAGYAEEGRFEDAELTARRALALATSNRQAELAAALEQRIALYAAKTPLREANKSAGRAR
jgi:tetratricopeptide (TPR) repeat protein